MTEQEFVFKCVIAFLNGKDLEEGLNIPIYFDFAEEMLEEARRRGLIEEEKHICEYERMDNNKFIGLAKCECGNVELV